MADEDKSLPADPNDAPQPQTPDYVVAPRTLWLLLGGAAAGGALIVLALLLLMLIQPQGTFVEPDREMYRATVQQAQERLADYEVDPDTSIARLPIERAMELVADRGVDNIEFAAAEPPDVAELPDGESVYAANCAACHQAEGQGVPGAFPPMAGHVPEFLNIDNGRTWLIHVVLYGLVGEIEVDGVTYDGVMPAFGHLSDEQIAAVLNHIATAWENEQQLEEPHEPYDADEVEGERDLGLSPADVYEERQELGLD